MCVAIEALRHEVAASVLFEEAAGHHFDTGFARHAGVRVLDRAVALWVFAFFVSVTRDAVELNDPVFKALFRRCLAKVNFLGLGGATR